MNTTKKKGYTAVMNIRIHTITAAPTPPDTRTCMAL
jgi:hypothetical protein